MTRASSSTFITQMRQTRYEPVTLIEIETGDVTTPWIRLTSNETDQKWPTTGGNTFTARPFTVSEVALDAGDSKGLQIVCADEDNYFKTWLATTDFVHKKLKVYLVDRGDFDSSSSAKLDTFRITNRARDPYQFTLQGEPLSAILARITFPARSLTREDFPGIQRAGSDR